MTREAYDREMTAYLKEHGVRYFTARELAPVGRTAKGKDGKVVVLSAPPKELWPAILPTLYAADWLRERLGSPLTVTSAWRSPAYNAAVGGVAGSQHPRFTALDLFSATHTPTEVAKEMEEYPQAHLLGIGEYPTRGFTHIDSRGERARWTG